ncbi:ABC transporter permease [Shimia sp.]|uniref:ABC transporter permease n=1 Tax=Shimia sp. TaxID=1954381 RepID=UPI003BAC7586
MLSYAVQSLWNRRFVASLTVLTIALSVALILGVERLRDSARQSFFNSVSGIDLIVAPRGNDVQILMSTVFGVGSTGAGMNWQNYKDLQALDAVDWAVPLMMGDNHRGHPVVGTQSAYFDHFRYGADQPLRFAAGRRFETPEETVIGADVAARFGYGVGTEIVNAHGTGAVSFELHDDAPFTVSGILAATGTPVDRMVFVSLSGFDALHAPLASPQTDPLAAASGTAPSHKNGANTATLAWKTDNDSGDATQAHDTEVSAQINGVFVGLKSRNAILAVQRHVSANTSSALSAVMPNVALLQLWAITGTAEKALRFMSLAVAVASLIGMVVMLSAALESRRREFAILRSVGATPRRIVGLIIMEAMLTTTAGIIVGLILLICAIGAANPVLFDQFGFRIAMFGVSESDSLRVLAIFCFGCLASFLPAWRVYRITLADGLTTRL